MGRGKRGKYRGGLGVRKKLSEQSLKQTYRLNGVRTGSTVAKCLDRFGRWDLGYELGTIVRQTPNRVWIRWDERPGELDDWDQGDARYEVDRGRWRILAPRMGNPLDSLSVALTEEAESAMMRGRRQIAGTPTTEENSMSKEMSNAAAERAAAKQAVDQGSLKDREEYSAKQVAMRCGTDAKTMRKFFRSNASTVEPVGQGGRYVFDARDLPKIKREFETWRRRAEANNPQLKAQARNDISLGRVADAIERAQETEDDHFGDDPFDERDYDEPSPDDLADIEMDDLELDDLED